MGDVTARTDAPDLDGPPPTWAAGPPARPHAHVDAHLQADLGAGADVGTGHVEVDLDAVASNVASLGRRTGTPVLAVVKADAYGHGLVPVARAALAGGASWLGRGPARRGPRACARPASTPPCSPGCCPATPPRSPPPCAARSPSGVSHPRHVEAVVTAARASGQVADLHVKVDTGLHRNGVDLADLPAVARSLAEAEQAGLVAVSGVFSHLAWADAPQHPTVDRQAAAVRRARSTCCARPGCAPGCGTWPTPRPPSPGPTCTWTWSGPVSPCTACRRCPTWPARPSSGLRPALTLRSRLAHVRRVAAGEGVSYGHAWSAPHGHRARPRAAGLRRRPAPLRHRPRARSGSAAGRAPRARGRPDLHGPGRRRPRPRRAGGRRRRRRRPRSRHCSASPPPRTGPSRRAPSPTRSSPAWAPGCPGAGPARATSPWSRTSPPCSTWARGAARGDADDAVAAHRAGGRPRRGRGRRGRRHHRRPGPRPPPRHRRRLRPRGPGPARQGPRRGVRAAHRRRRAPARRGRRARPVRAARPG